MTLTILALLLGSYVVSLTATIPPGPALQYYLCNGSLESNTTVVLDDGEHRISSGPSCNISDRSNVTIRGSSIKNTTVRCEEGSGLWFISVQKLTIERMTFINCVINLTSTEHTYITDCVFQNSSNGAVQSQSSSNTYITNCEYLDISAPYLTTDNRGAVYLRESTGNVNITNCTFQNIVTDDYNDAGGAVWLDGSIDYVSITNCTFQNNNGVTGGAVSVRLYGSIGNVSITNCTFQNNSADILGGAVCIVFGGINGYVSITNSTFLNNSAAEASGGAVILFTQSMSTTLNVSIANCTFQNNSAAEAGGAIFITLNNFAIINNCSFTNNTAKRGAAVHAQSDPYQLYYIQRGNIILQEVIVENNYCSSNCAYGGGGAIYFSGMNVNIYGDTLTGSQFLSNYPLGAIQGENGLLQLYGNITFKNNTGVNGGAISLPNNAPLYFHDQCRVQFSRNVATGFGGAIYNDGGQITTLFTYPFCTIIYIEPISNLSITFTDNHAQQGGHAIYATPIFHCKQGILSYATFTPSPENNQAVSFPERVQLCNSSDQYWGNVTTYPGRTVRLNVTSVDNGNNLSPSVVYTVIDTNGDSTLNIALEPSQKSQWIGTVCATIEYQIYGPEMVSLTLVLSTYPGGKQTVIEVMLLPCEPGFTLTSNSSNNLMTCDCSMFFTSHGVVCDASDGTVTRNKNSWIGLYNNTLPALASNCPLDYCNTTIIKLSLARPGDLCNGGRTGIICGHCHGNHSVIFGSSLCKVCSDMWLMTLVMFAVLGALLVAALFFLNLTVTQGTLYGLIFYANIIQVNSSIFFSQSILNPLQVVVSFVNLDLGIPLCFYDGMDDADKVGLQFVFPAYILILTITVIGVCHYCLQRSPTTSTRTCVNKVTIIIGQRAVGVLSTLIYLSYSKLLRTVIDVLTYSSVQLPRGDVNVWFYDGNVEYLQGKHAILFVVAMVTFTLFLLPYTIALTFIPIIERYSEHNRLFNYLHKKVNQIKPMNDAHYAPYKGEWRWWLGARLWLVVVMFTLNPVYSSDNPSLLLTIQATMVIVFMLVQAEFKPFGLSFQKSDKYITFCNQLYNYLDLIYLFNYTALALSMLYILDQSSDQTQLTVVCVGILVGLYVMMVMMTVLYHLIVVILKAWGKYDKAREKIKGLFERIHELFVPTTNTVLTPDFHNNYGTLREPLCED